MGAALPRWLTMGLLVSLATCFGVVACGDSTKDAPNTPGGSGVGGSGQSGANSNAGRGGAGGRGGSAAVSGAAGTSGGSAGIGGNGGDVGSGGAMGGIAGLGGSAGGGDQGGGSGSPAAGAGGEADGGAGGAGDCTAPVSMPPIAGCGIYGTVGGVYRVGDATEQRLSFDMQLTAQNFGAIPLNQIEVHYYFSQEEDSGWQARVDSFVQHAPDVDLTATSEISIGELSPALSSGPLGCQTHFIRIRNSSTMELAEANVNSEPYLEFHVTLEPNDPAPPNQIHTNDVSYEPEDTSFEWNGGIGVFVCGRLVSGCVPGDFGICP